MLKHPVDLEAEALRDTQELHVSRLGRIPRDSVAEVEIFGGAAETHDNVCIQGSGIPGNTHGSVGTETAQHIGNPGMQRLLSHHVQACAVGGESSVAIQTHYVRKAHHRRRRVFCQGIFRRSGVLEELPVLALRLDGHPDGRCSAGQIFDDHSHLFARGLWRPCWEGPKLKIQAHVPQQAERVAVQQMNCHPARVHFSLEQAPQF